MRGFWAAEDDVRSNVVEVTPRPPAPTAPAGTPSYFGRVSLVWEAVPDASNYTVLMRETGQDTTWQRVAEGLETQATVADLVGRERYQFAVTAWRDGVESGRSVSTTVTVPPPRPVRRVRASSPQPSRVAVTGESRPEATSYVVRAGGAKGCARQPKSLPLVRAELARPRARLRTPAAALWVQVRAVRSGVTGAAGRTSTDCVEVR